MPHINIKLWPGMADEAKHKLAKKIVDDVIALTGLGEESFSVSFEEVAPENWKEQVYIPEIINKKDKLYKHPGYKM